jgi:hypothetical protein
MEWFKWSDNEFQDFLQAQEDYIYYRTSDNMNSYIIWFDVGGEILKCELPFSDAEDKIDFETNYKTLCNQKKSMSMGTGRQMGYSYYQKSFKFIAKKSIIYDLGNGISTSNTLRDSTKSWTTNQWAGKSLKVGNGVLDMLVNIVSNTSTELIVDGTGCCVNEIYTIGDNKPYKIIESTITKHTVKYNKNVLFKGGEYYIVGIHGVDDRIDLQLTDEDDILGYGAGFVLDTYLDDQFILSKSGIFSKEYMRQEINGSEIDSSWIYFTTVYTNTGDDDLLVVIRMQEWNK